MLVGHKKQWNFLKNSFLTGRLSHAYLFSGPEKIGKKTVALEFVKFLHCQEKNFERRPCNFCPSCQQILKGIHPDALFLEPQGKKQEIQISQIRELIYKLSLKPSLSSFKTAIIDKAHLMDAQAQNCLLKTLEEPKGNTILILVTCHPEILFETIRSRVQEIKFFLNSKKEILEFLKKQGVSEEKAREIEEVALLRIGRVIEFLKNPEKLERERKEVLLISKILSSDIATRFQYAKKISNESPKEKIATWLRYFREQLLLKTKVLSEKSPLSFGHYSLSEIKKIIEELEKTYFLISTKNTNKRLALEMLMLNIKT